MKKTVSIVGGNTTTTYYVVDDRNPSGYPLEEAAVQEALSALANNATAFIETATGTGIWGGSGSVSDCNFRGLSKADPNQAKQDQRRLDSLLALLARRLKTDGMINPRIESLGETHDAWARTTS